MPGHIPFRKVDGRLAACRTIWLSTKLPDGLLHSVPVWYLWDTETKQVYFTTRKHAIKARNLAHDAQVVIHAGDGDDAIILDGSAEQVTDEAERGTLNLRWQDKYMRPMRQEDLLYRAQISHIRVWEYGTTDSTRTDWYFERNSERNTAQSKPAEASV
jgi:general stress protein 26